MKCSHSGCTRPADKQCAECSRSFCPAHYEICALCAEPVCHDCREVHQSSPQHEGR